MRKIGVFVFGVALLHALATPLFSDEALDPDAIAFFERRSGRFSSSIASNATPAAPKKWGVDCDSIHGPASDAGVTRAA